MKKILLISILPLFFSCQKMGNCYKCKYFDVSFNDPSEVKDYCTKKEWRKAKKMHKENYNISSDTYGRHLDEDGFATKRYDCETFGNI